MGPGGPKNRGGGAISPAYTMALTILTIISIVRVSPAAISMTGVVKGLSGEMEGVAEGRELAIEVRGAYKGYGSLRVLRGLDMSVPRGHM